MIKKLLPLVMLCLPVLMLAQGVKISQNPGNPDPSAMLDIQSNNKGLLMPRLTTSERNAILNPAIGLAIYNTTTECFEGYFPGGWRTIACNCVSPSSSFTSSPNSPGPNTNVTFSAPGTPGVTYSWVFQSGNPSTSNNTNPVVTWNNPGTYSVTLTATDLNGCSSTTTNTITIVNCAPLGQTANFNYTGNMQTWTVPGGVCQVHIAVYGAQGGSNGNFPPAPGGLGGLAEGDLTVTPGQVLNIFVGASGDNGSYNGGGVCQGPWTGGAGGGASDVRIGGTALTDRIIVGGGGGGNAGYSLGYGGWMGGAGGAGGGLNGDPGTQNPGNQPYPGGGGGGTQSGGGAIGSTGIIGGHIAPTPGALGVGGRGAGESGNSSPCGNAASGGGGYYGGGGGGYNNCGGGGGGGGSSYIGGVQNAITSVGVRTGNGLVVITY